MERLQKRTTQKLPFPVSETSTSRKKNEFCKQLNQKKIDIEITGEDLLYCLQAIRGLAPGEIKKNSKYICALLRTWFNRHYASAQGPLAGHLRRTICWIDEALYMKEAL
jgi:hypothetical protein